MAAVVLAAGWLLLAGSGGERAAAEPPAFSAVDVLVDVDLGAEGDGAQDGWGEPLREGQRTYRTLPTAGDLAVSPWWPQEAPAQDAILVITFKDAAAATVDVHGRGERSTLLLGRFSGVGDGAWKQAAVYLFRVADQGRHTDGPMAGRWSVRFSCPQPVAIDRIQVVRATEAATAWAMPLIRRERATIPPGLADVPFVETAKLGPVGEQDRQRGFVPYIRNWTEDVYPISVPSDIERGARVLETYATPGEYEPMQVALHALLDLTATARITDLSGPAAADGAPAVLRVGKDVAVHVIQSVPVGWGLSKLNSYRIAPAWQRENDPVHVKAAASQAWYVTVHVPADAPAGLYTGTLTLAAEGMGEAAFEVRFKVLPFRLDLANHVSRGPYVSGVIGQEYVADLVEHGCNTSSMWQNAGLWPAMKDGRCIVSATPQVDDYLKRLKAAGFHRVVYFGGGDNRFEDPAGVASVTGTTVGTPEFATYYGQYWVDLRRLEKQNGWPEIICCPFDEPMKTQQKVANYLVCYEAVKKASPETKVFCVFMSYRTAAATLGRQADIWSCNGQFGAAQTQKAKLAAEGVEKQFWTYGMGVASSRPGSMRFSAGFAPWRYDADGVYFWAYGWSSGDPMDDLDGGHRDSSLAARDVNGKLYATVAWEAWREGIDDRLYAETALRLATEKGRKDVLERLAALKAEIAKPQPSATAVETEGLDGFFMEIDRVSVLDGYRARLAAMILEMLGQPRPASEGD
jgi:hypothetical protein